MCNVLIQPGVPAYLLKGDELLSVSSSAGTREEQTTGGYDEKQQNAVDNGSRDHRLSSASLPERASILLHAGRNCSRHERGGRSKCPGSGH